jgi:predicted ribosomally synthesized peptide with SipW-like signal peptide
MSIAAVAFVGALVVGATGAFFSDTETSTGNTFTAGAIDLTVDSEQHYNGNICTKQGDSTYKWTGTAAYPVPGTSCDGSWEKTDLDTVAHKFFNFSDVKPVYMGKNTISLHVNNNDAYACAYVDITKNDDMSSTEPELKESGEAQEDSGNTMDGELAQNVEFFAWADDGDNVYESGEQPLFSNSVGPASDVMNGKVYTLANKQLGAITGGQTRYIGLAWCLGDLTVSDTTLSCNGGTVNNITQTDSMEGVIQFYVEQARNNDSFTCPSMPRPVI